jgi:isoleucyl-tRNA synthetase
MYSGPRLGRRRKSAQAALFTIFESLCALLAPVLSFTAEEAWQHLPEPLKAGRASVFDVALPHGSERGTSELEALQLYDAVKNLRALVAAAEGPRDFQLRATVYATPALEPKLRALGDNLRESLVVSALDLHVDPAAAEGAAARIELVQAEGIKCARCWKTLPPSGDPLHPAICAPCAAIVRDYDAQRA